MYSVSILVYKHRTQHLQYSIHKGSTSRSFIRLSANSEDQVRVPSLRVQVAKQEKEQVKEQASLQNEPPLGSTDSEFIRVLRQASTEDKGNLLSGKKSAREQATALNHPGEEVRGRLDLRTGRQRKGSSTTGIGSHRISQVRMRVILHEAAN